MPAQPGCMHERFLATSSEWLKQEWLKNALYSREISCRYIIYKSIVLKLEIVEIVISEFFLLSMYLHTFFWLLVRKKCRLCLKREKRSTEQFRRSCWTGKKKKKKTTNISWSELLGNVPPDSSLKAFGLSLSRSWPCWGPVPALWAVRHGHQRPQGGRITF